MQFTAILSVHQQFRNNAFMDEAYRAFHVAILEGMHWIHQTCTGQNVLRYFCLKIVISGYRFNSCHASTPGESWLNSSHDSAPNRDFVAASNWRAEPNVMMFLLEVCQLKSHRSFTKVRSPCSPNDSNRTINWGKLYQPSGNFVSVLKQLKVWAVPNIWMQSL